MIEFIKKNKKIIISSSIFFLNNNINVFAKCCENISGKNDKKTGSNNNSDNNNNDNNNSNDNKEKNDPQKTKDNNEDPLKNKKNQLKDLLKKVKEQNNKLNNECKENITIDDNSIDLKTKDEELKEIETNLNTILININDKLEKKAFEDFVTQIKNKDNFGEEIGKGSNNTVYKAKCNGKDVIFSVTSEKEPKSRYNMDYIIKNTIINGLFSNIQPKIYNEYICDYIENGQFIEGSYDIFRGIQVYNKKNTDKKPLCIDDNIKNKLLLQQIVFSTGDQGVKNQIYNIEESNNKRIIKNVVFIDLDDELSDRLEESLYDDDGKVIFDKTHLLNEKTQKELPGIFNNLYDIILNKLDNNVKFAIDSNVKYERHIDYGKEKINEFKYYQFPIFIKSSYKNLNIFNKFKDKEKILRVDYNLKDFYELKCEGDNIFVKYKKTDEFKKIEDENINIYAKIDSYITDEKGDLYVMSGDKKVKINEIFTDKYENVKNCKPEIIDFNTALKAFKKHYLQYGYNKIQTCISSGFFHTITKELEECAKKYKEKIDNFDK